MVHLLYHEHLNLIHINNAIIASRTITASFFIDAQDSKMNIFWTVYSILYCVYSGS